MKQTPGVASHPGPANAVNVPNGQIPDPPVSANTPLAEQHMGDLNGTYLY